MKQLFNKIGQRLTVTVMGVLASVFVFAQNNQYNLSTLSNSIETQKEGAKSIVSAIVGLIFIAGIVHVIIAFVNHSQNLKQIVMSYLGAFIAFGALWLFL